MQLQAAKQGNVREPSPFKTAFKETSPKIGALSNKYESIFTPVLIYCEHDANVVIKLLSLEKRKEKIYFPYLLKKDPL